MPNPNLALQAAADLTDKVNPEQILSAAEISDLSTALGTVAVAFEQQTANLIAYLKLAKQRGLAYEPSENVLKALQANIEERLGLA